MLIKRSDRRYKDYRRYEGIERQEPFISKKNVKFVKRNRFINFVYYYVIGIKRLQWGRKHESMKLQVFRKQLLYILNKIFLYWLHFKSSKFRRFKSVKTNMDMLKGIKFRINRRLLHKLNRVKTYYKDAILRKELFFQENFPQETLSPHRKRRVLTYVKRLTRPHSRGYVFYSKFKIDLLFIMTSRLKKKEYKIQGLIDNNKRSNKLRTKPSILKEREFASSLYNLHIFSSPLEAIEFETNNIESIYLNQRRPNSRSDLLVGDMVECNMLEGLYKSRVDLALSLYLLFMTSYKKRKNIYIRRTSIRALIKSLYFIIRNKSLCYDMHTTPPYKWCLENIQDRYILFICLRRLFNCTPEVILSPNKKILIRI